VKQKRKALGVWLQNSANEVKKQTDLPVYWRPYKLVDDNWEKRKNRASTEPLKKERNS
jgi:hypothetical protein